MKAKAKCGEKNPKKTRRDEKKSKPKNKKGGK